MTGVAVKFGAAPPLMIAVAHHARRVGRHNFGERRLAGVQRGAGQVEAVPVEEIECEENEIVGAAGRDPVLQIGKARRAVGGERDQLAVDDRGLDRQSRHRPRERRKFRGPVEPVAGDQPSLTLVDAGQQPIPVVFDLMQPLRALGRLVDQGRQLRHDAVGHRPLPSAGEPGRIGGFLRGWFRRAAGNFALCRVPHPVAVFGDLVHRTAGRNAERVLFDQRGLAPRLGNVVALLDQEPVLVPLLRRLAAHPYKRPMAMQFFPIEPEFERALAVGRLGIGDFRGPGTAVPQQDGAAAILALRNDALEPAVIERVVFDMDREPLFARIEARSLRDRPAQ